MVTLRRFWPSDGLVLFIRMKRKLVTDLMKPIHITAKLWRGNDVHHRHRVTSYAVGVRRQIDTHYIFDERYPARWHTNPLWFSFDFLSFYIYFLSLFIWYLWWRCCWSWPFKWSIWELFSTLLLEWPTVKSAGGRSCAISRIIRYGLQWEARKNAPFNCPFFSFLFCTGH